MDIHNYKRRLERTTERIKESKDISERNREILLKFKDYCLYNNISLGKIDSYLFYTIKFVFMLKKLIEEATKEDIQRVIAQLNQTDYSEETKVCFKIAIRKLYKMIRGVEEKGEYPPEVKWISTSLAKNHKKLPEELLTQDEIEQIIRSADNLRDKTLLSTLAESGARISEIGTMSIKQVSFEEYGARLTISGKTGTRKILVISSTPYLQEWINRHPLNNNPDANLWYNSSQKNHYLSYARIVAILKEAAKRAGIKKRVYCHLLRHSQATHMASIMTEGQMKPYFGWTQGSKMASVYVHMSGKDVDEAIYRANGVKVEAKEIKNILAPIKCERCNAINEVTNKFCKICGLPLDKKEAESIILRDIKLNEADEFMNRLFKDPEFQELVKRKIKV
ncbi:MAG: tyrosine-type recombinase/integrase [Candidatus Nanoarchaeia archaeon]|nr:tyrosine-type recombinase/integrase [Candidatus Nanoarchaeia archaeon]MDD5740852.1 tyrosine-type recombinase/integrase [Candidatus Nanoarchaeia archaeon]